MRRLVPPLWLFGLVEVLVIWAIVVGSHASLGIIGGIVASTGIMFVAAFKTWGLPPGSRFPMEQRSFLVWSVALFSVGAYVLLFKAYLLYLFEVGWFPSAAKIMAISYVALFAGAMLIAAISMGRRLPRGWRTPAWGRAS